MENKIDFYILGIETFFDYVLNNKIGVSWGATSVIVTTTLIIAIIAMHDQNEKLKIKIKLNKNLEKIVNKKDD